MMCWLSLHHGLYKREGRGSALSKLCEDPSTETIHCFAVELTKNINRDLQRNWLVFFMSFLCGYSKVSLSSFNPFISFHSSAPSGPSLVVPNPYLLLQEPCSFSFSLLFPKRELHLRRCAALSAESATPTSSQQTTSFKGWLQTFPILRHKCLDIL